MTEGKKQFQFIYYDKQKSISNQPRNKFKKNDILEFA